MIVPVLNFKEVDAANVQVYRENGLTDAESKIYICTVCGSKTCIDGSVSNRGHKLMCMRCVCTNGYTESWKWVNE